MTEYFCIDNIMCGFVLASSDVDVAFHYKESVTLHGVVTRTCTYFVHSSKTFKQRAALLPHGEYRNDSTYKNSDLMGNFLWEFNLLKLYPNVFICRKLIYKCYL